MSLHPIVSTEAEWYCSKCLLGHMVPLLNTHPFLPQRLPSCSEEKSRLLRRMEHPVGPHTLHTRLTPLGQFPSYLPLFLFLTLVQSHGLFCSSWDSKGQVLSHSAAFADPLAWSTELLRALVFCGLYALFSVWASSVTLFKRTLEIVITLSSSL